MRDAVAGQQAADGILRGGDLLRGQVRDDLVQEDVRLLLERNRERLRMGCETP